MKGDGLNLGLANSLWSVYYPKQQLAYTRTRNINNPGRRDITQFLCFKETLKVLEILCPSI